MIKQPDTKILELRDYYNEVRGQVVKSQISKINFDRLKAHRKKCSSQLERMTSNNEFENYDQVQFYFEKFKNHIEVIEEAFKNKKKWSEINPLVKEIYKEEGFLQRNSYLKETPAGDNMGTTAPQKQSKVLQSFFDQKRSKIVPDVGFKSLLENPQISNKSFKKRIGTNNQQLLKLRLQNENMRYKLQQGDGNLSSADKQRYQQQHRRFQQRIIQLQSENSRLYRENDTLKSEKGGGTVVISDRSSKLSYEQNLYAPYFIQTQDNDLYKINVRNQSEAGYSNFDPQYEQDYGFPQKNHFDNDRYSEADRNPNQTYSVFDMSRSYFSETNEVGTGAHGKIGIQDPKTVSRNKIAFFKQAGILVKNQDWEIGYKKSGLDSSYSKQKIILYFNNKTRSNQQVDIFYDYQKSYYDLDVKQKVRDIGGFRQAREVVQVGLNRGINDLNSIIQMQARIGHQTYRLWLPAMFIELKSSSSMRHSNDQTTKSIYANRAFNSPRDITKILPDIQINNNEGSLWGASKMHQGPINLKWRSGNKLQVKTSPKWMDILTFVMFDYQ